MDRNEVFDFFDSSTHLYPTTVLKQHWSQNKFSYLTKPRPDYGLMLLLNGRIHFETQNEILYATPGDVIFLPKHCHYEAVFLAGTGEVDNYLVNFDAECDEFTGTKPIKLFENASLSCSDCFRRMVEERFSLNHTHLRSKGLFYLLLDAIINTRNTEPTAYHQILCRAQELLHRNEDIPIGEIARECCISESGLRRIFKEVVGTSPAKYRINARVKRAMYLLESTDLSVSEVADALNFFDAAYFCKVFRDYVGMTPKQYAQNKKL